jgi:hypothetical protein
MGPPMHETQYVKALATSLDEAIEQFAEHVRRHGGVDNWWTLTGALNAETGAIHVPAPSVPEWTDPDHATEMKQAHAEEARVLREEYATIEVWRQAAWEAAAAAVGVGGLPPPGVGDPAPAQVHATARFRTVALDELPRWFLREAREELVRRYGEVGIDEPADPSRAVLAAAFEALLAARADEEAASHLPFLRDQRVDAWPSHRVGDGARVFYLMIDMHR